MSPDPSDLSAAQVAGATAEADKSAPVLRVVHGAPTAEEVAALVTVLSSRATTAAEPASAPGAWADPAARLRQPLRHGPGAWRWAR